jgi:hypothetical protein
MSITSADLDALDRAIASAELEVDIDGRRVRYRSTQELIAARAHLASVLATQQSGRRRASYQYQMTTARGD